MGFKKKLFERATMSGAADLTSIMIGSRFALSVRPLFVPCSRHKTGRFLALQWRNPCAEYIPITEGHRTGPVLMKLASISQVNVWYLS
jgi:hypothetical protein